MEITMIFYDFIGLFKTMFSVGEGGGAGQCKSVGLSLRPLQSGEGGQIPSMQSATWGGIADLRSAKADGGIADLRSAICDRKSASGICTKNPCDWRTSEVICFSFIGSAT